MRRYVFAPNRLRSQHFDRGLWLIVLFATTVLTAYRHLSFVRTASGQISVASYALQGNPCFLSHVCRPFVSASRKHGWRSRVNAIGLVELLDVASGPALSSIGLQNRLGLRLPLPKRVALQFGGPASSPQILEASLCSAKGKCMMIEVLGVSSDRLVELQEIKEESNDTTWRVCSSTLSSLPEGTCVSLYDTTPCVEAPETAMGADGMKNLRLKSSETDPGNFAYNGFGGVQLEGYPRELDGINCTFTVWSCTDGSGNCRVAEDGDDASALVCEFGPRCIKDGLKSMLPGETRRFWIPAEVDDRRFGRPPPDRYLPAGSLVVDVTLHSITREAVFNYNMSDESAKLSIEREQQPGRLLLRAIGVGVQILPLAWYVQQQQQQAGDNFDSLM